MTPERLTEIVVDRMSEWSDKLVENHATPIVMLALGNAALLYMEDG